MFIRFVLTAFKLSTRTNESVIEISNRIPTEKAYKCKTIYYSQSSQTLEWSYLLCTQAIGIVDEINKRIKLS